MASKDSKDMPQTPTNGENTLHPTASVQLGDVKDVSAKATEHEPALAFMDHERVEYTPEEGQAVLRRIDWHILPMLMWVYCIQFADKTSLNYASVMGIREDINLDPTTQQYSWASSIFYAGYIAWE